MAKGDGSITKLGPNKYRVQVSYGKDPITGKYQRVTKVVSGTKADARKVRDQIRRDRESGLVLDGNKVTFEEFARTCIETARASDEITVETMRKRFSKVNCICRYIGNMKLKEITPQVVEATLAAIKQDKTEERGSFSNSTLRNYHGEIKSILKKAVDYEFILRNPCDKVKPPVADAVDRRSLDAPESASLLQLVDKYEEAAYAKMDELGQRECGWPSQRAAPLFRASFVVCVRIGLATGMRIGEVLGLLWDSVDFEQGSIIVRRSLSKFKQLKKPKTKKSTRTIYLDEKTLRHLNEWKHRQAFALGKIGITQGDLTPVCCNAIGTLMEYSNFHRAFGEFRKDAGIPDLIFHELRHTQATLLLSNGVDIKTVQERLGHADASITLNVYAHALPENDKAAANLIGDLCTVKRGRIIKVKTA